MQLSFGFSVKDLHNHSGLKKLFENFLSFLEEKNQELYKEYIILLEEKKEDDKVLIQLAVYVQDFLLELFNLQDDFKLLQKQNMAFEDIKEVQKTFINKYVKLFDKQELESIDVKSVKTELLNFLKIESFNQFIYAKKVQDWLKDKENFSQELSCACKYGAYAFFAEEGKKEHEKDFLFFKAQKIDFENLAQCKQELLEYSQYTILEDANPIVRQDFSLHDKNDNLIEAIFQSNYCVHCHFRGRDHCSKGAIDKENNVKQNPLGTSLSGCPLNMHISQMHYLNTSHNILASFVMALINNPMLAGTGHRICNDCASSCIYQKQQAVDTPKAESIILKQVLSLPFGFELYSLLTKWNPCNIFSPYMQKNSGKKVLVVGAGPAGYTLSHYLLMQGHEVVCIEGSKIEALPNSLVDENIIPLQNIESILSPLEARTIYGFGGVSEYGITARWDKNYLNIIRIILERNESFSLIGGVAFGSNINYQNAKELGFDHIAFCTGAGKANALSDIKNSLVSGVKLSSDFLMNLHLSSATLENYATFLQLKMPIVVIGGGLTAIDVATESFVYYIKMVEKLAKQFNSLSSLKQEEFLQKLSEDELKTFQDYLNHNQLFEDERQKSIVLNKKPDFKTIMDGLGGVKVVYRKDLKNSPAYKLNYKELNYAFREGVNLVTNLSPFAFNVKNDCLSSVTFEDNEGKKHELEAKTVILALGNSSNKSNESKELDFTYYSNGYLKPLDGYEFIASYYDDIAVSFFGDTHVKYKGSVVNAMASAKKGALEINDILKNKPNNDAKHSLQDLESKLKARVISVKEVAEDVFEVIVRSEIAAQNFKAGQFFKLQAYNNITAKAKGFNFNMEPVALTGASVDKTTGNITLYAIKAGVSSSLISRLKKDDTVVLMGPNGKDLNLPSAKNVLLVGGSLGNAVLLSIAKELQSKGNKVTIVAGYKKKSQLFAVDSLQNSSDNCLFCVEDLTDKNNKQNFFKGNVLQGIEELSINLEGFETKELDYIITIGSSKMMEAVADYVNKNKKSSFKDSIIVKCELNSLMSCMMKEVCGSCVQKIVKDNKEEYVYACAEHCHNVEDVDFTFLNNRLKQNNVLERLSSILLESEKAG